MQGSLHHRRFMLGVFFDLAVGAGAFRPPCLGVCALVGASATGSLDLGAGACDDAVEVRWSRMTSRRFSSVWHDVGRRADVSGPSDLGQATCNLAVARGRGRSPHLVTERKLSLRADADGRQKPALRTELVLLRPSALARGLDRPVERRPLGVDLARVDDVRLCEDGQDVQVGGERGEEDLV